MTRLPLRRGTMTAAVILAALAAAPHAAASCAGSPPQSSHVFTGTVISTEWDGRLAHVRTDDGRTVTVYGTSATTAAEHTSVDRTYTTGTHYQFDPVNAGDPFQDNICTLTHQVSGGVQVSPTTAIRPSLPAASGPNLWVFIGGGGAVLLGVGAALLLWRRRRLGNIDTDVAGGLGG